MELGGVEEGTLRRNIGPAKIGLLFGAPQVFREERADELLQERILRCQRDGEQWAGAEPVVPARLHRRLGSFVLGGVRATPIAKKQNVGKEDSAVYSVRLIHGR